MADLHQWLGDTARLKALTSAVRAKIPPTDVDDIVQSTLADALSASAPPEDLEAFERWLFGIARHKVADYHRRKHRLESVDSERIAATGTDTNPESARDLLRWVDKELPQGAETNRTLEWMMREASGDRLETIAQEQRLSAPLVRQRVSRLRRYLREQWALQIAAALGLLVVLTSVYAYRQSRSTLPPIRPDLARVEVHPTPVERAQKLRQEAIVACQKEQWQDCLSALDRAKALDPAGDETKDIQTARSGAAAALSPAPRPAPSSNPAPVSTTKPVTTPTPLQKAKPQPKVPTRPMQQSRKNSNFEPFSGK